MRDRFDQDEHLVRRIAKGDNEAFSEVIEQNKRLVSHIVFRMVRIEADREDLCQEVFIRALRNISSFQFRSRLSTWIARIAYNTCGNYLEKKRLPLYDDISSENSNIEAARDDSLLPDEVTEMRDISARLRSEIESLPPQFRTIITLYHLDDMSYREIEEVMGLPEGTVKSYLFRARKLLKERLLSRYQMEDLWEPST